MAKRPAAGIQDIYLIKRKDGWATPGDGLFRISCDYASGVAGVLRSFYRLVHSDKADFVLDEIIEAEASGSAAPAKEQCARLAMSGA